MAARDPYSDPYSDDFMDVDTGNDGGDGGDDEEFGETTMADLASSTPTRRARVSFLTPPTTSPAAAKPMTPSSQQTTHHATHQATPCSDMSVQAALPDPEKQRLEDELASLQLEICKLTTTLESCSALESRLSAKLATAQGHSSDSSPDIEARLGTVLQTLSDRTAALMDLNTSLKSLGFPGSDASEVITSLSTALRNARLELEYMTPGEIDLPLTTAGGAVLNMILDRLRTLSKKHREAEDSIDEYHSIELSLRQQLSARVEAMDGMSKELGRMEGEVREKDERIAELEVGLERLKGAVHKYTRDISELESLVQRMEAELEAAAAARRLDQAIQEQLAEQHAAELSQKASAISDLDAKLSAAVARTESLQGELATMQAAHAKALDDLRSENKTELANVVKSHGQALASRDARVVELRVEIDRVNASLRAAHETVRQLRVENGQLKELNDELASENGGLETTLEVDRQKATEVIISMKTELERVLHMGEGFLSTPKKAKMTPGASKRDSGFGVGADEEVTSLSSPPTSTDPNSGPLLGGDLARKPTGKKRRRYDSGLGFPDEDEINVDA
ncbi:hypothetical protein QBC46DRAFT_388493 [Diplogelasinospora grovesii]|uniref:Uncharacterized protein n=1 Tax=Diplogelasinospora grovesii TaxID=303347 RepID=A0AAN6N5J9_9PEZI|nr:hypothetical protein QBC46DRAFT_388493 [Diplogelasinospora grovesii]